MASLFPAVVHYEQVFVSNDMKQTHLERTVAGRKQKSQIPRFTGDSVEMLLYTQQWFNDAMETQGIDADECHNQFGQTLHGDPSDLWQEVLQNRDDGQNEFGADEAGFNLAFEFYVKKYVADPNARDTMV